MKNDDSQLVDVLMATFNGEKYVTQQIDTILNQTHSKIHLYIRDDGSQDSTWDILKQKQAHHSDKLTCIPPDKRLGVVGNFSELMKYSTANYVMFSDQDDVWLPNKISKTLEKMHLLESNFGANMPLMVHTDLIVVDGDLKELSPSFWKYANIRPEKLLTLNRLLMQSGPAGGTMMLNRALLNLIYPIPANVIIHDWWISLIASALGKIDMVPEATVYYRQHGANQIGAKKCRNILSAFRHAFARQKNKLFVQQKEQARLLSQRYSDMLSKEQTSMLETFCKLDEVTWSRKIRSILQFGLFKQGFLRNLELFLPF